MADDLQPENWTPLVQYKRFEISENTILGAVSWASGDNIFHSLSGTQICYGRSTMKPLMVRVFAKELGKILNPRQKAISCSSHNGTLEHVRVAKSILRPSESYLLQTPLDYPMGASERRIKKPHRWYSPCSGEHAALIRGCQSKQWDLTSYLEPSHPFFKNYLNEIRAILGSSWTPVRVAKDGCGLPTVSMSVDELALIFSNLTQTRKRDWIWDAMTKYPNLVGGAGRLDSAILKFGKGKLLAKEGADGLLAMGIVHPDFPRGLGVAVKIAHGWNPQAAWFVARKILGCLGFDFENPPPLKKQRAFISSEVVPDQYKKKFDTVSVVNKWAPDEDRWITK